MPDRPKRSPLLQLHKGSLSKKDLAKIRDNFSAVVFHEGTLWLGGDEGTLLDRMTQDSAGDFGHHTRFDLKPLLGLQGGPKAEIDIEGLDFDDGYLWLTGSHSLKRKKAEEDETEAANIDRLAEIAVDEARFTIARVPITKGPEPQPVVKTEDRTAARLEGDSQGNLLTQTLKDDPHLGPFVPRVSNGRPAGIPSKDNGLDVEGLAISGGRMFLGLRGPVLRGWALVLEIQIAESSKGRLTLDPMRRGGKLFRKHFLQLEGLGVRELAIDGKHLFILAGPTMDLDGPVFIYKWRKALDTAADSLTGPKDLEKVISVPFGIGADHAEGMTLLKDARSMMICYDSPAKARLKGADGVQVDVFAV